MLFSLGPGSKGTNVVSYSIRLPVFVSPGKEISSSGKEGADFAFEGYQAEIQRKGNLYVIIIRGFPSEQIAGDFLRKVGAGLIWADLRYHIGLRFTIEPTSIHFYDPPLEISDKSRDTNLMPEIEWTHIDGDYYGDNTVIVPEHKRLILTNMGRVNVIAGTGASILAQTVSEAMAYPNPERVFDEPKLKLAYEVYSSAFFESSDNARFLTLVMVLEVLRADNDAPDYIVTMVDELMCQLKELRSKSLNESYDRDYGALVSGLGSLKKRSKKQGISSLVAEKLKLDEGVNDPTAVGREVSGIYDLRSKLVHDGIADPNAVKQAMTRLEDIVPRVLKVMFSQIAKGT
jgi:hypothetical protein